MKIFINFLICILILIPIILGGYDAQGSINAKTSESHDLGSGKSQHDAENDKTESKKDFENRMDFVIDKFGVDGLSEEDLNTLISDWTKTHTFVTNTHKFGAERKSHEPDNNSYS